jgi:hypothetical protein
MNVREWIQFAKAVFWSFRARRTQVIECGQIKAVTGGHIGYSSRTAGWAGSIGTFWYAIDNEIYKGSAGKVLGWVCTAYEGRSTITTTATTGFKKILFSLGTDGSGYTTVGEEKTAQALAQWPPTPQNQCAVGGVCLGSGYAGGFLNHCYEKVDLMFNPADDALRYKNLK